MEHLLTIKKVDGQLLIELLIAIALFAILLPALLSSLVSSREGKAQQNRRIEAVALEKESEEVVRSVREKGWSSFAINGVYHPIQLNNAWVLAPGSEIINGFTRSITLSDVYRDSDGVVVSDGGIVDPSTKKVEISVEWTQPILSTVSATMYVTRYVQNTASTQTSESQFQSGINNNTQVTNTAGGEIALAPNTKAKWCSPTFSSATIDLPDGPPVAVAATASASVLSPNKVFVATAPNLSTSIKLAYLNITADTEIPSPTLNGTFTLDPTKYSSADKVPTGIGLDNSFKTNDIKYYTSASGKTYALIATTKPDREVIAVLVDDNSIANDNDNTGEFQDHENNIYKYWTYFNTIIYNPSGAGDTGFRSPTANSSDTGGDGDGYQTNPTRGYGDNSSFAVDTNSGNGSGTSCTGSDKDKHRYYNYGFTLPSGPSIDGIEVRLDARVDNTNGSPHICVQMSWDGGVNWTTAKSTSTLTTSEATYILGGSSDRWGRVWNEADFSNPNFRVRVIDVSSDTNRDFSLDWVSVKIYYSGGTASTNDQAPFDYGGVSLTVLGDRGYVASGGYLYVFDLSNIDSKSPSNPLEMIGCRIQVDGFDCQPGAGLSRKYDDGETGTTWSETNTPVHSDCSDGGNIELYASNDLYGVKSDGNNYIFVAVGAGTNPEFNVVNATSVPNSSSSPSISSASCGRISTGNSGWKMIGSYDFNSNSGTEEAANSVYANNDGSRVYISSNGTDDSKQFYILNTSNKSSPTFLSGSPSSGPSSGYYQGSGADGEMYPRRSLTVLGEKRVVLVGKDGVINGNDAKEYQVLNSENEVTPIYCGGVNFDQGFNDLTAVSEADKDNFVYMVGSTTLNELKIIQGGPDGTYLEAGVYESTPVDAGQIVAFNRISPTVSLPANTTLQYQIAVANTLGGSCLNASYQYLGPDGTANTYFPSSGGSIPLVTTGIYANPGQCIKYKAYLSTTDYNVTPSLLDMSVNYSL